VPVRDCNQGADAQFFVPFAASANTPVSRVHEAYRQLVALYFPTDRRSMDLLLTDLDAQLCARLPTYQHALASGKPFDSILAGGAAQASRHAGPVIEEGADRNFDGRLR